MGWTDSHLHQFEKGGKRWGTVQMVDDEDDDVLDEGDVYLEGVLKTEGDSMMYEYDVGDSWRHEIVVEKVVPNAEMQKPICLGGERHSPPEDIGGVPGYKNSGPHFDPTNDDSST